ncbi:hypothetical protein SELMODRAFT_413571 [Selaginella moellendorffii]|uniref:Uncharacterized protein n=1 Tax=Selaginella moellendorffii TaxID=88036 RepID=D8RQP7_SELML|nr:hypothetical protein SELMODRAFT_413571 [Selaginella moellendorffii]
MDEVAPLPRLPNPLVVVLSSHKRLQILDQRLLELDIHGAIQRLQARVMIEFAAPPAHLYISTCGGNARTGKPEMRGVLSSIKLALKSTGCSGLTAREERLPKLSLSTITHQDLLIKSVAEQCGLKAVHEDTFESLGCDELDLVQ